MSPRRINSRNEKTLPSSRTWKVMKKGKEIFSKGTRWSLGHDNNLKFWLDTWTSKGPLRISSMGLYLREKKILVLGMLPRPHGGIGRVYP